MIDVLEEIEYYGFLVKSEIIEDTEFLKRDRQRVYLIWQALYLRREYIMKEYDSSVKRWLDDETYFERFDRFSKLLEITKKYWAPDKMEIKAPV